MSRSTTSCSVAAWAVSFAAAAALSSAVAAQSLRHLLDLRQHLRHLLNAAGLFAAVRTHPLYQQLDAGRPFVDCVECATPYCSGPSPTNRGVPCPADNSPGGATKKGFGILERGRVRGIPPFSHSVLLLDEA